MMRLALDLGTTSLVGRLLDAPGTILAERRQPNPQAVLGSDVLRRLEAARDGHGEELQRLLAEGVNTLTESLLDAAHAGAGEISAAAAAANPAVSLLLQNLPPEPLLAPPYRPADCSARILSPPDLEVDIPVGLYLFPLVNGFVGGDLVAFLFGQPPPTRPTLYVDIGTNGEIALFADGQWRVTSVAAGPAFEGAEISSGMIYGPGAIENVTIEGDRFDFAIVGDEPPRGICGSGLAAVIGAARGAGLIDRHGTIVGPDAVATNLARYVKSADDGCALELYRDARRRIRIGQRDVRNFQLAKAAVRAGIECLLDKSGVEADTVADVVLTGAFGVSLPKSSLKRVAMLPEIMIDKVRFEPDGALSGVGRMLMLEDGPARVDRFAKRLNPYPLSGTPAFEKAFLRAIDL